MMLRQVRDGLLKRIAGLRPRMRPHDGVLKVNLGGGIEVADGWVNADGNMHALLAGAPRPVLSALYRRTQHVRSQMSEEEYVRRLSEHSFVFCDFTRELPFASNSVDFLFCSHVLEHFTPAEGARLMREVLRVLKPGGWARITVPDLAIAMRLYQQGAKREALEYFFTGESGAYDQHHYMYDAELLMGMLRQQGFTEISERNYREGRVPDLEQLDNRPDQTLYVEARKHMA